LLSDTWGADELLEYEAFYESPEYTFVQEDDRWFLETHVLSFWLTGGALLAELPEELYLREFLELDVKSPEAVGEFCATFGPVGQKVGQSTPGWYRAPDDWPRCDGVAAETPLWQAAEWVFKRPEHELARWLSTALRGWLDNNWGDAHVLVDEDQVTAGMRAAMGVQVDFADRTTPGFLLDLRWFGEVEIYQSFLRDLCGLWDFLSDGRTYEALRGQWTSDAWGWQLRAPGEGLSEVDAARLALAEGINPALNPYTVHVEPIVPEEPPGALWHVALPLERQTVYSAMCLQLANQIAKNSPYRRCRNELCGRLFEVKRGGHHGHRERTSTYYCSDECANRQYQREHRRRVRDARRAAINASKADLAPANDNEGGSHDEQH
jgi:hypothetical protein